MCVKTYVFLFNDGIAQIQKIQNTNSDNGGFKNIGFFMIFMLNPVVGNQNKKGMVCGLGALALPHYGRFIGIYNTIGPDSLWRLGVVIVPII